MNPFPPNTEAWIGYEYASPEERLQIEAMVAGEQGDVSVKAPTTPSLSSIAPVVGKEVVKHILGGATTPTMAPISTIAPTAGEGVATSLGGGTLTTMSPEVIPGAGAATTPGALSLSGIGATGNVILPIAGLAGAYDLFKNKKHGFSGAAQGAASGAAIGSFFPGVGTGIGAGVGALAGYFGNFGDVDRWKTEGDRIRKLRDAGIKDIPETEGEQLTRGRTKEELVAREQQKIDAGGYGNTKFANSRLESDLGAKDVWGAAANYELLGNDYLGAASEAQREAFQNELLKQGLWQEHQGTLDITDKTKAKQIWDDMMKNKVPLSSIKPGEKINVPGSAGANISGGGAVLSPEAQAKLAASAAKESKQAQVDNIMNLDPGRYPGAAPQSGKWGFDINLPGPGNDAAMSGTGIQNMDWLKKLGGLGSIMPANARRIYG